MEGTVPPPEDENWTPQTVQVEVWNVSYWQSDCHPQTASYLKFASSDGSQTLGFLSQGHKLWNQLRRLLCENFWIHTDFTMEPDVQSVKGVSSLRSVETVENKSDVF